MSSTSFLPDFTPARMVGWARMERVLEHSRLRSFAVHFMAQLIKAPAARSRPLVTESAREGVERRNHRFLVCLFAVLFGLVVLKTAWMSDDAYFSVRAGYNLMHGHGLTSNADERVHGFTNPGWTVLLGWSAGCRETTTWGHWR